MARQVRARCVNWASSSKMWTRHVRSVTRSEATREQKEVGGEPNCEQSEQFGEGGALP